jgi:DNA-directed RNA polymerase specialized sigma24 family protein
MEWSSPAARDGFWRDLLGHSDRRLRAYIRRCMFDSSQTEEIIWDVWAAAVGCEDALVRTTDQWTVLRPLVATVCAGYVRSRRGDRTFAEFPLDVCPSEPNGDQQPDYTGWLANALHALPEKQRLAVDFRIRWQWPYWAIAAAIDAPEVTARVYVRRGLEGLRRYARETQNGGVSEIRLKSAGGVGTQGCGCPARWSHDASRAR